MSAKRIQDNLEKKQGTEDSRVGKEQASAKDFSGQNRERESVMAPLTINVARRRRFRIVGVSLLSAALLIALVALSVSSFFLLQESKTRTLEESVYQYILSMRVEVDAPSTLVEKDGEEVLQGSDNALTLDTRPLYIEGQQALYLPKEVAVVSPLSNGQMKRTKALSKVEIAHNMVILTNGSDTYPFGESDFLFDGKDTYVFLHEFILECEGQSITLSPLSSVEAPYQGLVTVYDYAQDRVYIFENATTTVKGHPSGEAPLYSLDLSSDTLHRGNESQLLLSNVASLPSLT